MRNKDQDDGISPQERRRRRGMAWALSSSYLTVMGAKCALPSVLSLLTSAKVGLTFPTQYSGATPQALMAKLLGISTLAVALGKLVLGPVIDSVGGIRSLQLALTLLALLVAIISVNQSFAVFALCWMLVDFVFSSCWAGCINAIHQSFPQEEWSRQIGFLAAGARAGNAAAFTVFASILYSLEGRIQQTWRVVFGVSSLLQAIPLLLLFHFGGMTLANDTGATRTRTKPTKEATRIDFKHSLRILGQVVKTPRFWMQLVSRACLMVYASFLLFVPTLMSSVYGASSAVAAQTGSVYALGCLFSVTVGSSIYSKLSEKRQAWANTVFLTIASATSLLQLGHVSGLFTLDLATSILTMFLWGISFAIPFYIPPSLYALAQGGKESSATIADAFDIGGFSLLAIFNSFVASIEHSRRASWIPVFQATTACAMTSLVSLSLAMRQGRRR